MSTIRAIAKSRKGQRTVYVEYQSKGIRKYINTNFKLDDSEVSHFNGSNPGKPFARGIQSYTNKNSRMTKIYNLLLKIENELPGDPTPEMVMKKYNDLKNSKKEVLEKAETNLIDLLDEWIENDTINSQTNTQKSNNTIKTYKLAKTHILKFYDGNQLAPDQVNKKLYTEFRSYSFNKDMDTSYFGGLVKNLKVFFRWIQEEKEIDLPNYRTRDWRVQKSKSENPIYLEKLELQQLIDFKAAGRHESIRDVFVFACQTGLRYGDLKGIRQANYNSGKLSLIQRKNKKKYNLPLQSEAKRIWEKYEGVLPVVSNQKSNEYLKELFDLAEIEREVEIVSMPGGKEKREIKKLKNIVSMHDAVHTFITLAIQAGLSPYSISTIVGKSVKVILDHYYGQSDNDFNSDLAKLKEL